MRSNVRSDVRSDVRSISAKSVLILLLMFVLDRSYSQKLPPASVASSFQSVKLLVHMVVTAIAGQRYGV